LPADTQHLRQGAGPRPGAALVVLLVIAVAAGTLSHSRQAARVLSALVSECKKVSIDVQQGLCTGAAAAL